MTREEMRAAIRPLMSEERYLHSLGVEREAERLARRWGRTPKRRRWPAYCTIAARKCPFRRHCKSWGKVL